MKAKYIKSLYCMVVLLMVSCGVSQHSIKVDEVEPVHVARFDSLVYRYVHEPDSVLRQEMIADAGHFWGIYNHHIMRFSDAPYYYESLTTLMADTNVAKLYGDALVEYSDTHAVEQSLALMMARYKKLFPDAKQYVFQTHISALKRPIVVVDSLISISIDCYLGADYELYQTRYRQYDMLNHTRESLLSNVGEMMIRNMIPMPEGSLVEMMIYEGIIAHALAGLLDDTSLAAVLNYTPEQEAWCMENKERMWCSIVEQGHLFTHDKVVINKYILPAPFTSTLTQDAPGRVGRWIGWRIVEQYMEKQRLTVEELLADRTLYMDMLHKSHYNAR